MELRTETAQAPAPWAPVGIEGHHASERRREPRYPVDRVTLVHVTGSQNPERTLCRILDASSGGMRIRTQRPLDAGVEVRVTLREMFAFARVRYCLPVSDGFDHGLQVQEIRPSQASAPSA
jgi:hypothetical protein